MAAFFPAASSTMWMIRETAVWSPTDSTRAVTVPSTTTVPAKILPPFSRRTDSNSPVIGAWLIVARPDRMTLSGEPVCLHRRDILSILELDYVELLVERDSSLVLFYHPEAMEHALCDPANRAILARCGYPADADARALLNELQRRFRPGSDLPHEVGVFLGYPAKDVAGFMANLPRTPVEHGRWAVYGDATESVARMTLYRRIEAAAERVLNVCGDTRTFLEHISTLNTTIGVM